MDDVIWKKLNPAYCKIMITMLLMANHRPNEWEYAGKRFNLQPGEFWTSLETFRLACGSGVTINVIRKGWAKLENLGFCTVKRTKAGSLVTICNWDKYQAQNPSQEHTKEQRRNTEGTHNKNEENEKNKIQYGFDIFWKEYHTITKHKEVAKDPAFKKWKALTNAERAKAVQNIVPYYNSTGGQYMVIARTYLADKRFNDEMTPHQQQIVLNEVGLPE